jgi:hypothetical protein
MAAAEQRKSYQVIKQFKGVDTKANRTAIGEDEFSWLENVQPIGFGNLKVVPTSFDLGITFSHTVTNLFSVNIGLNDYIIAFESDGSAEYVNIDTLTKGTIAPAGTFTATGKMVASQWNNEYAIIGDPLLGYFTWDGTSLLSIGSVGLIGIVNPGDHYTTAPVVKISAPNQSNGVQATAICSITTGAGSITSIGITNPGAGYTSVPTVTISAPNLSTGTQATALAGISAGNVAVINITNAGTGYTSPPSVTITGGGGSSAAANATIDTGSITAIAITNAGSGYTAAPTVTFSGGGGANASAVAELITFRTGSVAIAVTNGGTGYSNSANLTVTIAGDGANAAATGIISGGQVTQVVITNPGTGYTTGNVTISGGGGSNATATLVPTVNPTVGIDSFSGRVWLAQGRTVYYSAAGSVSDFTSVSAGSVTLTDSTLHANITRILSANNFLYIFGDDSINVFSDVRVTSTGSTLFTNTNVSASVGSKLTYAIFPYFRSILLMNNYGIYALVGSTTSKISDALDGIFTSINFETANVSAGQVLINNILCAAFNFQYTGTNGVENGPRYMQAVFFEKKWFFTSQGDNIFYITSAPIAGQTAIFGTDGTKLLRFYNDTTSNINSYVQTALLPMGDPIRTKQALKFAIEASNNAGLPLNVTVDSEQGSSPTYVLGASTTVLWVNNSQQNVSWTNQSSQIVQWQSVVGAGYYLYKSDAAQWGKYLGLTVQTQAPSLVFNTFEFEHELRVRF